MEYSIIFPCYIRYLKRYLHFSPSEWTKLLNLSVFQCPIEKSVYFMQKKKLSARMSLKNVYFMGKCVFIRTFLQP